MKKLIITILLVLTYSVVSASNYAIVTYKQGKGTAEDTLTVLGYGVSNTTGNIVDMDSVYFTIVDPKGSIVYKDSADLATFASHDLTRLLVGGRPFVRITKAVSTLVGGNKMIGTYTGVMAVVDTLDGISAEMQEMVWPFSFTVNPTLLSLDNLGRKYYYNTTYPWIVDSTVYYMEDSNYPVAVMHYKALGTTRPDTVGVSMPQ